MGTLRLLLALGTCAAALAAASAGTAEQRAERAEPVPLAVYLVRGERVAPVRRLVPHTRAVARAALAALLRGPTADERRRGYRTAVPAGTSLRGVVLSGGVATVDLSRRFESGGGSLSMLLRVAQVVHTLTQFPSVERAAFELDGRPVGAIGGEGVIVSPPVGRKAFEGQAPPILVEQPLPGDRVGRTIVVRGTANVFEARLVAELRGPGGVLLVRRQVLASAGTGVRGSFSVRLAAASSARRLEVVVYARSPKNGAPIHRVSVPVVRPA